MQSQSYRGSLSSLLCSWLDEETAFPITQVCAWRTHGSLFWRTKWSPRTSWWRTVNSSLWIECCQHCEGNRAELADDTVSLLARVLSLAGKHGVYAYSALAACFQNVPTSLAQQTENVIWVRSEFWICIVWILHLSLCLSDTHTYSENQWKFTAMLIIIHTCIWSGSYT